MALTSMQIAFTRHLCSFQNGPLSKIDLVTILKLFYLYYTLVTRLLLYANPISHLLHVILFSPFFPFFFFKPTANILPAVWFNYRRALVPIIRHYLTFVHRGKTKLILSYDRMESFVPRRINDICMQSDSRDACRVNQVTRIKLPSII